MNSSASSPLVIERTLQAPAALVWKSLTDPEAMRQWYFDVAGFRPEPGTEFEFTCEEAGRRYRHLCKVVEVIPQRRLSYTWRYDGQPGDSLVTFDLTEQGDRTCLRLSHEGLETFPPLPEYARSNFEMGWNDLLGDSLPIHLAVAGADAFVIEREFDAPRDLVWRAWTERERFMKWFGPKGWEVGIAEVDLQPGGSIHYCLKNETGEMWGLWQFREIVPPEKLLFINSFSNASREVIPPPFPGQWTLRMLTEVRFAEVAGKTRVTLKWFALDATKEQAEFFVKMHASFRQGWGGTFEQLDEYLRTA